MVSFPNAKINLGLNIVRRRDDGYHDLQTVFYPIACCDVLEILALPEQESPQFQQTGLAIEGSEADNLCLKACNLIKKDFPELPPLHILLHKAIPMGAGLGGGSADASFTLTMLNGLFNLALSQEQLLAYALQLGSDCPFFIINKPCIGEGRGERLEPLELDLSRYSILLVNPGIHVHTGKAFAMLSPTKPHYSLREIIKEPVENWKGQLTNDFETPVFSMHPVISEIRNTLYQKGALYAAMSGSGSTVYGIFEKTATPELRFPHTYTIMNCVEF